MDVMALEIANESDEMNSKPSKEAYIKALVEKTLATGDGSKQFKMEQQAELNRFAEETLKDLSKEDASALKKTFNSELSKAIDEKDNVEAQNHFEELKEAGKGTQIEYKVAKKLEYAIEEDDENFVAKSRREYVYWFNVHQRRTARATLDMCRTVYEAQKGLSVCDFVSFCNDIGYEDTSSTIRKFIAIGKVYPRLIDYAEQLPNAWTNIYLLTQISADDFERCIKDGFAFNKLTGSELKQLVDKTRDITKASSPFKMDKKQLAYPVATVFFTKLPDDTDYRLLMKAFDEVSARLPIRLTLRSEQSKLFNERREQRYEQLKQEAPEAAVKPQDWDYGVAANAVYDKEVCSA